MHAAPIDLLIWSSSFLGELALCFTLLRKERWRTYPAFTLLISFQSMADVSLFLAYSFRTPASQALAYSAFIVVNFPLQLAVVVEISRVVLRPTGTWVRDAAKRFITLALAGGGAALALSLMVQPPTHSLLDAFEIRGNLFTSLLMLELFVAMTLSANSLGLGWRNHVMALAQGLTAWSVIASLVDSLHSFLGAMTDYWMIDRLRSIAFVLALVYWTRQFWQEEPARRELSPQLRKYIKDLHDQVRLDLGHIR